MDSQTHIRLATPEDAPQIATIKIESWREAYSHILRTETLANLNHNQETERFKTYILNQEHILVATDSQGKPVAYSLWVQLQPQLAENESTQSIIKTDWPYPNMLASLYVHPDHYGRGLGTALLRANAQLALHHHHKGMMIGVFKENIKAKSLYMKLGAVFIKTSTYTVDGTAYPDKVLAFHDLVSLTSTSPTS